VCVDGKEGQTDVLLKFVFASLNIPKKVPRQFSLKIEKLSCRFKNSSHRKSLSQRILTEGEG